MSLKDMFHAMKQLVSAPSILTCNQCGHACNYLHGYENGINVQEWIAKEGYQLVSFYGQVGAASARYYLLIETDGNVIIDHGRGEVPELYLRAGYSDKQPQEDAVIDLGDSSDEDDICLYEDDSSNPLQNMWIDDEFARR